MTRNDETRRHATPRDERSERERERERERRRPRVETEASIERERNATRRAGVRFDEIETKGGEARVAVVSSGVKPSTDVGGFVERRDDVGERERAGKRRGTEEVFVIFE